MTSFPQNENEALADKGRAMVGKNKAVKALKEMMEKEEGGLGRGRIRSLVEKKLTIGEWHELQELLGLVSEISRHRVDLLVYKCNESPPRKVGDRLRVWVPIDNENMGEVQAVVLCVDPSPRGNEWQYRVEYTIALVPVFKVIHEEQIIDVANDPEG